MVERRKYVRFLPRKNSYAAVGSDYGKVGKLQDISIGGVAFTCITDKICDPKHSQVDIFVQGKEFHLFRLPCKIVYDVQLNGSCALQSSAGKLIPHLLPSQREQTRLKRKQNLHRKHAFRLRRL